MQTNRQSLAVPTHESSSFLKTVNHEGSSLELQTAVRNYREYVHLISKQIHKAKLWSYLILVISSGKVLEFIL